MKNDLISPILEEQIKENALLNFSKEAPLNRRAKLDLGKGCNRHCSFCYYETQLSSKDWLIPENARTLVSGLLDNGITQIELSGGEPTMNPYYFDIIDTIKEEFTKREMQHYITIVTNGWFGINDMSIRKHCKDLKEVLISLHGTESKHNSIVKNKMAHTYIENILKYLRVSKLIVRMNFVVYKDNLDKDAIEMLYSFIKNGNIQQLNLLPLNFWSDAQNQKQEIDIKLQQEQLEAFLKKYEESYSTNFLNEIGFNARKYWHGINIRYHSYCQLQEKYHKYIVNHYDHVFDLSDWNKIYYPKDLNPDEQKLNNFGLKFEDIYTIKEINPNNSILQASKDRLISHYKTKECRSCEYSSKCDGFKK